MNDKPKTGEQPGAVQEQQEKALDHALLSLQKYGVAREIQASGAAARFQACDVTELSQLEDCVAAAVSEFGGLDIMMNNAVWSAGGLPGLLWRTLIVDLRH